jgi:hypothetical protein
VHDSLILHGVDHSNNVEALLAATASVRTNQSKLVKHTSPGPCQYSSLTAHHQRQQSHSRPVQKQPLKAPHEGVSRTRTPDIHTPHILILRRYSAAKYAPDMHIPNSLAKVARGRSQINRAEQRNALSWHDTPTRRRNLTTRPPALHTRLASASASHVGWCQRASEHHARRLSGGNRSRGCCERRETERKLDDDDRGWRMMKFVRVDVVWLDCCRAIWG